MRIPYILLLIPALAAAAGTTRSDAGPDRPPAPGIEELSRLDRLAVFRESVKVGAVSSYDRTGGNDDGFSGRFSFVRKEGDGLVIADLQGPGVIYRIWTPTPTDDPIEFYFDGETEPRLRLKFRELFTGTRPPFVQPVVGFGAGGFWSYVPLPYRRSCKVVIRAPRVQFYQINYATYPEGAGIETFRVSPAGQVNVYLERARRVIGMAGKDITQYLVPEGTPLKTAKVTRRLEPGGTVSLFSARRGGRIVGLRLSPAAAFAGKDRALLLRMFWDGEREPSVQSPAGDFFGYGWGEPAARSLFLGTEGDTNYLYLPMPFDRSAKIELVSERRSGPAVEVQAEVVHADLPRRQNEGKLYAFWRRENPTTEGRPFTFINTEGRGHLVGVALQAQGLTSGATLFFEGDDQATIDGELVAHGTGSEDFFNGGWYDVPGRWEGRASFPLTGALDYDKPLARTGAYRFFPTDAYAYRRSLLLTIEHAPTGNTLLTDYAAVTYLYSDRRPAMDPLPPLEARAVRDLDRIIYHPGWNVPLHSFSMQRATLAKKTERLDGEEVRFLSMRAEGEDVFGTHGLALLCKVPAAGRYRVSIEAVEGPEGGIVRLFQNEGAAGEPVDLYAERRRKSRVLPLGELELREGTNPIFLKLTGKNARSTSLGLDLVTVQFEEAR